MGINVNLYNFKGVRDGYEISEKYIQAQKEEIEKGNPVIVEVRDLSTIERKIMRAIIKPEKEEGFENLWIRTSDELILQEPWYIKPIEEVDDRELDKIMDKLQVSKDTPQIWGSPEGKT